MGNIPRFFPLLCGLICSLLLLLTLIRNSLVSPVHMKEYLTFSMTRNVSTQSPVHMKEYLTFSMTRNVSTQSPINDTRFNKSSVSYSSINGTKSILLWHEAWGYRFHPAGRAVFIDKACPVSNCVITLDANYVRDFNFDAFVIHPPTQKKRWTQLKKRRQDQIFVLFTTEPPMHMPPLQSFDGYFNWSITYRKNSDFYLRYGEIVPLSTAPNSEEEVAALRADVVSANINANVNPARGKSKMAIWLVSNCKTPSNREEYVSKLRNHIKVDIFSKNKQCGGVDGCPRDKNDAVCYNTVERDYKFYLSFENSICDEYVTEKFYEMMGRNIIPVVLGGANYSSIAPPHSYINARDYTPKQLADYMKRLDANDTLYAEYFWWKPHYQVRNLWDTNREVFCDLCAALHSKPLKQQTLTGLQKWYIDDAHCLNKPHY